MDVDENMEYTLDDALGALREKKAEQERIIDDLINKISNNEVFTLKPSSSLEDVKVKQDRLHESLRKEVLQVQPEDYPIPRTSDLRVEVMTEMEAGIREMQEVLDNLQRSLSSIQEDVVYLRSKKKGLDEMRQANLDITETFANITYKKETILTKKLFQQVKNDLHNVVDTIFPNNEGLKEFLATLTSAYTKGGDNVYVDVTPDVVSYINFLLEADLIQYHPNDKNKVRMTELL
ncbi:PREDICTED: uncharacterized protein LOC105569422 [Vollenhovia emeryi]|uniref:uncharacterized protein LOC105569422 n=1 Tax=Vollenhovia emeryi TaxID=411798 RepID=UPI0005F46908|nr:PREDICTED: uncharacterized protein LOC105569422 [Vollenhovia emeryi]XP_011881270.1 PREDICTED: uncharacterized protein LOC105569422 [Vollenhovia emeryi]